MTPIQALSKFHANMLSPSEAWSMARKHLHESMGWSAVLSHALKKQPDLHPQLSHILQKALLHDQESIAAAFLELKTWGQTQTPQDFAPALAVWASQSEIEHCTVADLVADSPLSWQWDLAVSLMDVDTLVRPNHQILVNVLWMQHMERNQSKDQHVDPSIFSTEFSV